MTTENIAAVTEQQLLRADIYSILAALLRQSPTREQLDFFAQIEPDQDAEAAMVQAWQGLKLAAQTCSVDALEDEYFNLFIGLGHGEVIPYASWYLTGSLMDKPLVQIRQDLAALGFERQADRKEPEDHLAVIFEVMATLLTEGSVQNQLAIWQRHIAPWANQLFADLSKADNADFYAAVAVLGQIFIASEQDEFETLVPISMV